MKIQSLLFLMLALISSCSTNTEEFKLQALQRAVQRNFRGNDRWINVNWKGNIDTGQKQFSMKARALSMDMYNKRCQINMDLLKLRTDQSFYRKVKEYQNAMINFVTIQYKNYNSYDTLINNELKDLVKFSDKELTTEEKLIYLFHLSKMEETIFIEVFYRITGSSDPYYSFSYFDLGYDRVVINGERDLIHRNTIKVGEQYQVSIHYDRQDIYTFPCLIDSITRNGKKEPIDFMFNKLGKLHVFTISPSKSGKYKVFGRIIGETWHDDDNMSDMFKLKKAWSGYKVEITTRQPQQPSHARS